MVYHGIMIWTAEPIKSRMQHTPLHFEKEEEASLKNMLDAGVTVESNSEYAHPMCSVQQKRWQCEVVHRHEEVEFFYC